jgi:hypothetical protein
MTGNDRDSNVKEALKNDWEQTKNDVPGLDGADLDQDVDDTVKQAAGKEPADASQNR